MQYKKYPPVVVFIFLSITITHINAFFTLSSNHRAYQDFQNGNYEKVKDYLEKQQIEDPYGSEINYNLGATYYKLGKQDLATRCYQRLIEYNRSISDEMKEKSYFNWGNALYQQTVQTLPAKWETEKIPDETLQTALNSIKSAIEKYQNVLVLNEMNQKALVNKKKAIDLLKKLEQKQQQEQEQQQQEQKQDQDQKEKEKEKEKKNQQQEQEQRQQEPGQQEQRQQEQKPGQQNQEEKQNKQAQGQQQSQQQQEQQQQKNQKEKQEEQAEGQQDQEQQQSQQDQDEKQQMQKQQKQDITTDTQKTDMKEESIQLRGIRVLLDQLQADEARLQKQFIMYKTNKQKHTTIQGQKPW